MLACTRLALHKGKDMSEVKRYEEEYGGVGERKDGLYVKYEDYATLQKKLDAVLAESVVKSDVVERLICHYRCAGYDPVQNSPNPARSLLYDAMQAQKAPATDAILNAVRAEGIEILTGKLQQLIDEGVFDAKEIGVAAGAVHEGAQIAAQLRAETDTTSSQYESLAGGK